MEENNYGIQKENSDSLEIKEPISLGEAITEVIIKPSKTFESIASGPNKNYWLVPVIILMLVYLISNFLIFTNEDLKNDFENKQRPAIEKQLDKEIEKQYILKDIGEFFKEEAFHEALKRVIIYSFVFSIVEPYIFVFFMAFLYYLVLIIMKTDKKLKADKKLKKESEFYMRIVNIVGLSVTILAASKIIEIIISVIAGKLITLSLGLLITESQIESPLLMLISNINIFDFWFFIVISIGIAKISGQKYSVCYSIVFGFWVTYLIIYYFITN